MLVLDPLVVAAERLPPWALALSGGLAVVVAAAATLLAHEKTKRLTTKSGTDKAPRKVHQLGTSIPIIGDMLEVNKNIGRRHDWLTAQSERFNFEPWAINIPGTPPMIVVTDPALIEAIMVSQFDNFVKGPKHREISHDLLGDGIVNADGEQWYHQRKTAAKFFSARTLRLCMMQAMQRNMLQVYEVLDASCGAGDLVNLTTLLHQFALQTFLEVGVGIDEPIIGNSEPRAFTAEDEAMVLIMKRRLVPRFYWRLMRWLKVGQEKTVRENMDLVYEYINGLVEKALTKQNTSIGGRDDAADKASDDAVRTAIDLFVEHSREDTIGLRPRDLVDFVLNFVLAARDTSSVATLWLFYRLSKHPEIEARIRKELRVKLPALGIGRDGYITADHVKELVYLDATIKETLRLHPAAPFMVRQAVEDTVLDGDLFVRKGQAVGMSVYAMARNPRVWGPDAAEFKPERWIDPATGELISFPATKFFTFSAGPRTCIGMKLAMLTLRVLTANLLHRYKFEVDRRNDGSHVNAIALAMKHELLVKVEKV